MNSDPNPNTDSRVKFTRRTYVMALSLFAVGIFVGFAISRVLSPPVSNEFGGWKQEECTTLSGGERDGIRIGDEGPCSPDNKQLVQNLMANYVTRYNQPPAGASASPDPTITTTGDNFTTGGNISRCVLLAILKSLDEPDMYVPYSFGYDGDKTILLIQGGHLNPVTGTPMGQPLLFRTGTNVDCFCPNQCGINFR
jgi:hypothetical protein